VTRPIRLLQLGSGLALATSLAIPCSRLPDWPLCPFRLLTGFPCPGCGLTHAFCDISHGHLGAAWQANPFGFLFYTLALTSLFWPGLRARFPGIAALMRETHALVWAPAVLIVLMWLFDVARIARL
jgi:hypothetical protein